MSKLIHLFQIFIIKINIMRKNLKFIYLVFFIFNFTHIFI